MAGANTYGGKDDWDDYDSRNTMSGKSEKPPIQRPLPIQQFGPKSVWGDLKRKPKE